MLSDQREYEAAVAAARGRMIDEDFLRAWDTGRRLSVEQAVEIALSAPLKLIA